MRLGEVCEHKSGIWGPEAPNQGEGYPIVRSTEIDGYIINPQPAAVRAVRNARVDTYKLESGDILVNKSSGSPRLVGWPAIFEDPHDGRSYLFSNFMLRLRVVRSQADPWFILRYLHAPQARVIYLGAQDTTSGLRNLRVREFLNLPIPLPPLDEQRRIVARVEALMERIREARRLREETRRDADRLWQSVLADTFPRPGSDLPPGWRWVRLGEVCEIWDKYRKPVKKKDRVPGPIPYCGANGVIDYVDECTHEGHFVLLAEDGGFYGPGERSAYSMFGKFWANNHVHVLRGKDGTLLNAFLEHWLVVADLRPLLSGATRPKLTQTAMKLIPIPSPPLPEQRRIVARLEAVRERMQALKKAQQETEARLKELERSILEKAFRGEL